MDANFAWLYRQAPSLTEPDRILLVSDKIILESGAILAQKTFGALTAYILIK